MSDPILARAEARLHELYAEAAEIEAFIRLYNEFASQRLAAQTEGPREVPVAAAVTPAAVESVTAGAESKAAPAAGAAGIRHTDPQRSGAAAGDEAETAAPASIVTGPLEIAPSSRGENLTDEKAEVSPPAAEAVSSPSASAAPTRKAKPGQRFWLRDDAGRYLHFSCLSMTGDRSYAWSGTEQQLVACRRKFSLAAALREVPVPKEGQVAA